MPSFTKTSLPLLLSAVVGVYAQAATEQQLAAVTAEYDASEYNAAYPDGFGLDLQASALLNVAYGGSPVELGQPLTAAAVGAFPSFSLTPGSNFTGSGTYTLMLADANPLGNAPAQAQGQYRHFLANGITLTSGSAIGVNGATLVTPYVGPGPAAGEGPHRYAWLLFEQPANFQAPAALSAANTGPGHWYVNQYVMQSHLGPLVAASFFTVEAGQATYSVVATSSVNTATIAAAASSTSAPASSASASQAASSNAAGSVTASASAGAASSSSKSTSGASQLVGQGVGIAAAAVVAALAL